MVCKGHLRLRGQPDQRSQTPDLHKLVARIRFQRKPSVSGHPLPEMRFSSVLFWASVLGFIFGMIHSEMSQKECYKERDLYYELNSKIKTIAVSQGYFLGDLLGLIKFGSSQEEYNSCCESQTKAKQLLLCFPPMQHPWKLVNCLGRICLTYAYQLENSVYIYNVIPVRIIQQICFDLLLISGHLGRAYI